MQFFFTGCFWLVRQKPQERNRRKGTQGNTDLDFALLCVTFASFAFKGKRAIPAPAISHKPSAISF
jgi:hypothetical protein